MSSLNHLCGGGSATFKQANKNKTVDASGGNECPLKGVWAKP